MKVHILDIYLVDYEEYRTDINRYVLENDSEEMLNQALKKVLEDDMGFQDYEEFNLTLFSIDKTIEKEIPKKGYNIIKNKIIQVLAYYLKRSREITTDYISIQYEDYIYHLNDFLDSADCNYNYGYEIKLAEHNVDKLRNKTKKKTEKESKLVIIKEDL